MAREKFDLDKFILSLDEDDSFNLDEKERFTECPRCGSDTWDKLYHTKRGKISHCNECKDDHAQ